jgi:DNA-binding NtrC family response regulator
VDVDRGPTVLLVEDDPAVRNIVGRMLRARFPLVLIAADAREALEHASSSRIDILVTDLLLKGPAGPELAERLRAVQPDVHVLYISGWSDHRRFPDLDPAEILPKPFTQEELEEAVSSALKGPNRRQ